MENLSLFRRCIGNLIIQIINSLMQLCPFNLDRGDMRLLQPSSEDTADSTTVEALDRQILLVPTEGAVQPSRSFHRVRHQGPVGRQHR